MPVGRAGHPLATEAGLIGRPDRDLQPLPERVVVATPADLIDAHAGRHRRAAARIEVSDGALVFGASGRSGEQAIQQHIRAGPQALAARKIELIAPIAVAVTQLACLQFPTAFVVGCPAQGRADTVAGDAEAAGLQ